MFASHVFIFATLIVVLAIRTMFAAPIPAILYAGTVPMTAAVVLRLLLLHEPFYLALASMAVGVHLYFIFLARGLRSTALSMLEFRSEKDCAHRRARGGEVGLRRGAPARRGRQQGQVALPRHHEPRAEDAAQCHPRVLRGDEDRAVRPDGEPHLPRVCGQHPRERPPPAASHQRDPRPHPHRSRAATSCTRSRCGWPTSPTSATGC